MLILAGARSIATYQYYWGEPLYSINRSDKDKSGVFRMVPMAPHGLVAHPSALRRLCVDAVRMAQVEPGRIPVPKGKVNHGTMKNLFAKYRQ